MPGLEAFHKTEPGVRTAVSARTDCKKLADKAVCAPCFKRFEARMRVLKIAETSHESGRLQALAVRLRPDQNAVEALLVGRVWIGQQE